MYYKFLNIIKLFLKIKLYFELPKKNKILLYDEVHAETFKEIIKKDFNILNIRDKKIYFWIYLKQIIFFDFSFSTYCKNYIKFTSPKVIITFNEARYSMYELKSVFKNISFIAVMNGTRFNYWFKRNKAHWPKKLECDYLFVLNKYYIAKYKKLINSNYHVLGHFRNNLVKVKRTKFHNQFLLISELHDSSKTGVDYKKKKYDEKLLKYINLYLSKSKKKLHILLKRSKNSSRLSMETDFYKKIFKSNCIFHNSTNWKKKYSILDSFENIIFRFSTLGYEAISRKKKVAIFTPKRFGSSKLYFEWPSPHKKKYSFSLARDLTYSEVERVLNNVNNCSQSYWNKKHYPIIKDVGFYDKNNSSLRKIILSFL